MLICDLIFKTMTRWVNCSNVPDYHLNPWMFLRNSLSLWDKGKVCVLQVPFQFLFCFVSNSNGQQISPLRVRPSFFSSGLCILQVQHRVWRFSCQWNLTEHQPEMKHNHQNTEKGQTYLLSQPAISETLSSWLITPEIETSMTGWGLALGWLNHTFYPVFTFRFLPIITGCWFRSQTDRRCFDYKYVYMWSAFAVK